MAEAIVTDYLLELSEALVDVPHEVRSEIIAGVREELEGLGGDAAAARIRELGDPAFIAASAREDAPAAPPAPAPRVRPLDIAAGILVMVGGIAIPVVGWIAGIAYMWFSPTWPVRQKVFVTVLPTVAAAVIALVALLVPPMDSDLRNPLIPAIYDVAHSLIIVWFVLAIPTGIWLLATARVRR